MTTYRALVVEDEPVAAEANAAYLRRLDVEVVGVAASGQEALRYLAGDPDVDLILLDMHLKDGHGLALLRRIRVAGHSCDVIAVTSARDVDVVRRAVAQGKPVIVSMATAAASGGYWIAMDASRIVAEPATLTGSIGVFAGSGMNSYLMFNLVTNPQLMRSTGLFLVRHTGND